MASEVEWVPISLVASSDQRSTSDFTRASQARLACSYASSNYFCIRSITSVCSFPTLRNGIDASVDLVAIAYLPFEQVIPNPIDQNPWAHWRSPMDMMRQG